MHKAPLSFLIYLLYFKNLVTPEPLRIGPICIGFFDSESATELNSELVTLMRWAGHVARMGEDRGVHRVLVGKPEGKRPLGRPRRRWEDNIKMDLKDVGGGRGDWMELAQDRDRWRALVGTVRDFRVT